MEKRVLYVRIDPGRHRALAALTATLGMTLSELVLQLLDQWLYQMDETFAPPAWLIRALEEGLPIERCAEDHRNPDDQGADNVVRFAGRR